MPPPAPLPPRPAAGAAPVVKLPPADPTSAIAGTRSEHRVKMNRMRQKIASRLKEAQNTNAMLTTFNELDMSNIMQVQCRSMQQSSAFIPLIALLLVEERKSRCLRQETWDKDGFHVCICESQCLRPDQAAHRQRSYRRTGNPLQRLRGHLRCGGHAESKLAVNIVEGFIF